MTGSTGVNVGVVCHLASRRGLSICACTPFYSGHGLYIMCMRTIFAGYFHAIIKYGVEQLGVCSKVCREILYKLLPLSK